MKLLDVYLMLEKGEITEQEAAIAFGMSLTSFRVSKTRHGHRLPLVLSVLDKVREDKITRIEASEALEVSRGTINKLMQTWNVTRPIKQYLIDDVAAGVRREVRRKLAIDYIAGRVTLEEAALKGDITDRQVRRLVSDLLRKHFAMVFKDLKPLSLHDRNRLASEIETAEGLEEALQSVKEITTGQKSVKEEAILRIVAKKSSKKKVT